VPESEIRDQIQRVNEKQAAWNSQRLEKFLQIRRVLTADQLKQLQDLREELGPTPDWGGHGHGFHGGK
jgi:Spy/CpxP family protein refolding chaperone